MTQMNADAPADQRALREAQLRMLQDVKRRRVGAVRARGPVARGRRARTTLKPHARLRRTRFDTEPESCDEPNI